jgi:hypothetical protein
VRTVLGMTMRVPFALTLFLAGFGAVSASADTIVYSNIPAVLPSDWNNSLPYFVDQVSEFGARVNPLPSATNLTSATVGISNFATNPGDATLGYTVGMTLNIYNVGAGGSVGSLIGTSSAAQSIGWRPADDTVHCAAGGGQYLAADTTCEQGQASYVNFTFTGVSLPTDFIYGLAFNSSTGPAQSLNFGFTDSVPSAGTTVNNNILYVNTSSLGTLGDGGGVLGVFGPNSGWNAESIFSGTPVIQFNATAETPEPATFGLIGFGLVAAAIALRKKARGI